MLVKGKMGIKKNTEDKVEHNDYYWEKFRNMSVNLKYFELSEFDCPCEEGSGKYMDESFLIKLDRARDIAGIPFKINSGYRCPEHNKKVGGVSNSSHTNIPCNASDIAVKDSQSRFIIINALLQAGFTRIGIGKNFVHCDTDKLKNQRICWHYY